MSTEQHELHERGGKGTDEKLSVRRPGLAGKWKPLQRRTRGTTEEPGRHRRPRKFIAKPSQKSGDFTNSSGKDGASEGIRTLIGFRSHLANLLGISALSDFCLTAISHQSERKRIGTGSNCAKTRTSSSIVEHSEGRNRRPTTFSPAASGSVSALLYGLSRILARPPFQWSSGLATPVQRSLTEESNEGKRATTPAFLLAQYGTNRWNTIPSSTRPESQLTQLYGVIFP